MSDSVASIPEKRINPRRRTFLGGTILFEDRSRSMSCTIRNLSDGGARLDLAGTAWVPARFQIDLPQSGVKRMAQLVWRMPDCVGLRFL